eukprot:Sspe_Gene.67696::Locus_39943_Transcript_1_1_Confidence_1.000_Length_545::g.67696::m.67696
MGCGSSTQRVTAEKDGSAVNDVADSSDPYLNILSTEVKVDGQVEVEWANVPRDKNVTTAWIGIYETSIPSKSNKDYVYYKKTSGYDSGKVTLSLSGFAIKPGAEYEVRLCYCWQNTNQVPEYECAAKRTIKVVP